MTFLVRKIKQAYSLAKISTSHFWVPKTVAKVVQTGVNNVQLLVFANEDVGRELVFGGAYEVRETNALRRLVKPTDICIDVGANIGYYTTLLATLASEGQVHAFEPVPINWHLLNCNILLNRLSHVRPNFGALAEKVGRITFSVSRDGAYSSLKATGREREVDVIDTAVQTLDAYVADQHLSRVDVIKADVEGAEGLVVEGALGLLADTDKRPRVLMLELFDQNLAPFGLSVPDMLSKLKGFGYLPYVAEMDGKLIPFEDHHRNRLCNVFFLRDDVAHLQG